MRDNFTVAPRKKPKYETDEYGIVSSGPDIGLDTNTEEVAPDVDDSQREDVRERSDEEIEAEIQVAKDLYSKMLVNKVAGKQVYEEVTVNEAIGDLVEQTAPYLAEAVDTFYMRVLINDKNDLETALNVIGTVITPEKLNGSAKDIFKLFEPTLGSFKTGIRKTSLNTLLI